MFSRLPVSLPLAVGLAAFALPLAAQQPDPPTTLYVYASLEGSAVPGGGAEEGYADFNAALDHEKGEICYTFTAGDIEMTVAHIHEGEAGESGPPVVTIELTGDDDEICAEIDRGLARKIGNKPGDYYVNLHTAEFPAGAIRGQLAN